jgi:L-lactate dehydrogenase complex protein LldG
MDREAFFDQIALRLGRARVRAAPPRAVSGVPDFHARAEPPADLMAQFEAELTNIGGRVKRAADIAHASEVLREELVEWKPSSIVTWARAEFAAWNVDWLWKESGACAIGDRGFSSEEEFRTAIFAADMGITTVEFAVAATGSLAISAAPTRPRAISLVPTVHLALVKRSQIVARMGSVLGEHARRGAMPSAIHFISGPSRTSDIENDLTIGVHGPAALVAVVVEGA